MRALIAKLLGIREDHVDGALKSDPDAQRFLSRRGLMLGAVGAAAGIVMPSAPLVQVAEQLVPVKRFVIEASWGMFGPAGALGAVYVRWKHTDGSEIIVSESP